MRVPKHLVLVAFGHCLVPPQPCCKDPFGFRYGGLLFPGLDEGFDHFIDYGLVLRLRLRRVIIQEVRNAPVGNLISNGISVYVNLILRRGSVLPLTMSLNLGKQNLNGMSLTKTVLDQLLV